MKSEQNKQQSDWLDRVEELNDVKAAQINGGYSSIEARVNELYEQQAARSLAFQQSIATSKSSKDNAAKVQA